MVHQAPSLGCYLHSWPGLCKCVCVQVHARNCKSMRKCMCVFTCIVRMCVCNRLCQLFHYWLTDLSFHYYCSPSHGQQQQPQQSDSHTHTHAHTQACTRLLPATSSSPSIKEAICSSGCTWAKRQVGGSALFTYQTLSGLRYRCFYFRLASMLPDLLFELCACVCARVGDYVKSSHDN